MRRRVSVLVTVAGTLVALATPTVWADPLSAGSGEAQATHLACPQSTRPGYLSCDAIVRDDVPSDTPSGYGPSDLQSAYDLPSADAGSGQTVAIVDAFDDPNAEADLAAYRAQFGLPPCASADGCFRKVDQRGGTDYPAPDFQWATEISLDVDMVSAACPDCRILLVEADDNTSQNLGLAVNEAVALGAKFVSNSYGGPEDPAETTWDEAYYHHPGVALTVSTGDAGFGVEYPAASPYVTAVGGTTLSRDPGTARGWTESAWSGAGSGCSSLEATPWWQSAPGCDGRAVADVSAVADPNTGVAVYDTYILGGWNVVGGTSAAAPLIAAAYALAGTPVPGSDAASYPYLHAGDLNDVTAGSNGRCSTAVLCNAGPGYDGPTGLGTPQGVAAFGMPQHGTVTGTVTDAQARAPIAGAQVSVGRTTTTTASDGAFTAVVLPGSYSMTVTKFGYGAATRADVAVANGQSVTEDVALRAVPSTTVSGTVRDASGHGWPLYARVRVRGTTVSGYTDPATGRYQLKLPERNSYRISVDPVAAGYQEATLTVPVGNRPASADFTVAVDAMTCVAPGYAFLRTGDTETFDATTTPAGWTVTDAPGTTKGWEFDAPGGLTNQTGGTGGFAVAASGYPNNTTMDTWLTSPVVDMSNAGSPIVEFDTEILGVATSLQEVQVSTDGGTSWSTVWQVRGQLVRAEHDAIALPQAAGQPHVQVRFHYADSNGTHWQLDNVFFGNRTCPPTPGGLLVGTVSDANTGAGIDGATVTGTPDLSVVTAPIPDGYYQLFAPGGGAQQFTATRGAYQATTRTVLVADHRATRVDFVLQAGRLVIHPAGLTATARAGQAVTRPVTLTNTGRVPVTVSLSEEAGGTGAPRHPTAATPLREVRGTFSALRPTQATGAAPAQPSDGAWVGLSDYPVTIMDNAVATDTGTGTVYSAGGFNFRFAVPWLYAYTPATGQWTQLANMPNSREAGVAAFVGGKLYVTGGWNTLLPGRLVGGLDIYDPESGTWSTGPPIPHAYAGAAVTVLNGRIYVIGGCDASTCGFRDVQIYDPVANTWTAGAPYPQAFGWMSCGAIAGTIYCAGGTTTDNTGTTAAYAYSPRTGSWTPIASLPEDLWASGYTAANGKLLMSGGVTAQGSVVTNAGFAYDPLAGAWSPLPNAPVAAYRGGSGCGMYRVGGSTGGFVASKTSIVLPGYDQCGPVDVPWLSESRTQFTVAPGRSATVVLTLDADAAGTFTGALDIGNDTPYEVPALPVTLAAR